jgi:hypothetical protein
MGWEAARTLPPQCTPVTINVRVGPGVRNGFICAGHVDTAGVVAA